MHLHLASQGPSQNVSARPDEPSRLFAITDQTTVAIASQWTEHILADQAVHSMDHVVNMTNACPSRYAGYRKPASNFAKDVSFLRFT